MHDKYQSILIIEDQTYQAQILAELISQLRPSYLIDKCTEDIDGSLIYLRDNNPDLIFMDIELGDQYCFELFDQIDISAPVIYCTSHPEYALESYYKNGIHFLTKPVTKESVGAGLEKFDSLVLSRNNGPNIQKHLDIISEKVLLNTGRYTAILDLDQIKFVYIKDRITFIVMKEQKVFTADITLDELEDKLASHRFFRINRQFLVSIDIIDKFCSLDGGKIKVILRNEDPDHLNVSNKKRKKFLSWIGG